MTKKPPIKLSYQKNKGFRKYIWGRNFWLGQDRRRALLLAAKILKDEKIWKEHGHKEWPGMALLDIQAFKDVLYKGCGDQCLPPGMKAVWDFPAMEKAAGLAVTKPEPEGPRPTPPATGQPAEEGLTGMTVEEALEQFKARARTNSQLASSSRSSMLNRMTALEDSLPMDKDLSQVGYDDLVAVVDYWTSRPCGKETGEPIGIQTILNMVSAARQFFYWLDDSGKWRAPRRLTRIFSINRRALLTDEERKKAARGVQVFSVDELKALYKAANKQNRLYILLGLNCGFASMEISTLRRWEIDLKADQPIIVRNRRKTDVHGEWVLWPETAALLKERLKKGPQDQTGENLAIVTRNGRELVRYHGGVRTDTVATAWTKLVKKAGVTKLGFKHLRKTGADMIRKIAGLEVSETYLAHSEKSLARFYSNPDYAKVAAALAKMREELAAMFVEPTKKARTRKRLDSSAGEGSTMAGAAEERKKVA